MRDIPFLLILLTCRISSCQLTLQCSHYQMTQQIVHAILLKSSKKLVSLP